MLLMQNAGWKPDVVSHEEDTDTDSDESDSHEEKDLNIEIFSVEMQQLLIR